MMPAAPGATGHGEEREMKYFSKSQTCRMSPKIEICEDDAADATAQELGGDWNGPFELPTYAEAIKHAWHLELNARNANERWRAVEARALVDAIIHM